MHNKPQLLICDDDSKIHQIIRNALHHRYQVRAAYHTDEAHIILKNHYIDILLLDIQMRQPREGLINIELFKKNNKDLPIIILSSLMDYKTVREAMRLGATDFIVKSQITDELDIAIKRAEELFTLKKTVQQNRIELQTIQDQTQIIGTHPKTIELLKLIEKIKKGSGHTIIYGESGTGKELIAKKLRKELTTGFEPFIAIDSSTIQGELAESLLFGHEKGAFSGAHATQTGYFEQADGGILFFDEIGNMPLKIQTKLLRVIEENKIRRLGGNREKEIYFRVICASNQNLENLCKKGLFKYDLYHRLNVFQIHSPSLRERHTDIPALISHFSKSITLSEKALNLFKKYPWPGNIRELKNTIQFLETMHESGLIQEFDVPEKIRNASKTKSATLSFFESIEQTQKEIIKNSIKKNNGNLRKTAQQLKMDRSYLYDKLKKYKIDLNQIRNEPEENLD